MTATPAIPALSIVIPAHNEASHLDGSLRTILRHLDALHETIEMIVVDDGSTDDTWGTLQRLAAGDPRLRALRLSRRFGKEAALCAGLAEARGRATVVMDSDLQHPPSLIPEMFRLWKHEGYEVVEAIKVGRGRESLASGASARLFYRLFHHLSGIPLEGATDFKLLDRKVLDAWARLPEHNVFFRGMSAWTGFRRAWVALRVPERSGGRSQWSSIRLLGLAIHSITSFSSIPIYLITAMGALFLLFAAGLGALALYHQVTGQSLAGFPTVILVELLIGSTVLISLGIVGQYIAHIYDEVKARPRFIVSETTTGNTQAPAAPNGARREDAMHDIR
jgi:glycosyltransferase involved in cell wall biosynthesis